MKVLAVLVASFIYALLKAILDPLVLQPLILNLNTTSDEGILAAGALSGLFTILYLAIAGIFTKACFNKIDQKKHQKDIALKENTFRQERICKEILNRARSENLSDAQIAHIVSDANLDISFQQYLTKELKQVQESSKQTSNQTPYPPEVSTWKCTHCGVENNANYMQCKKCGKYKGQS